ncbi:protein arginine N-methyltransferase 7-like isoform X2 [Halichondria panicea]|uniref:protein arginine N-methyltransferase 7-like isoform X2 n=1 Tax=Halichondria panicea TaxID=6063 RepID=UPI00312B8C8B
MFSGSVNPVTGKQEWVLQDTDVCTEEADISRELARSQYGDMLHDRERNHMYCTALEKAIDAVKKQGREPHVLDIGTGTGLLAMMAAKAGATRVTACEVLRPMVRIARQVIARNGFADIITVVPKRSTEMTEADMPVRANILVTEVFDTELIGEGALVTFKHAHQHLLEPGCVVIPSSSNMYVRLVDSEFLYSQHKLMPDRVPGGVKLPSSWEACAGHPSVWDLHVEEIGVPGQMKTLSDSVEIMRFQFDDPNLPTTHSNVVSIPISFLESGRCHGLVVWWDIDFGGSVLSMDPWDYGQWRDHWLQGVFLWPEPIPVCKGEVLNLTFHHDDYSIWFGMEGASVSIERPLCTCGVHTACSRTRVGLYNDKAKTTSYLSALKQVLHGKTAVCFISDGSMLPLLVAKEKGDFPSVKTIYSVENSHHCSRMITELLEANELSSDIILLKKPTGELTQEDFKMASSEPHLDAVVGEPFFSSSLLPWHNLHYWYSLCNLRKFMKPECAVVPGVIVLKAIAVKFENMYKLREPVGTVEGFNISEFDKAEQQQSTIVM